MKKILIALFLTLTNIQYIYANVEYLDVNNINKVISNDYLIKPLFRLTFKNDDKNLIKIPDSFLEKSLFDLTNDKLCLFEYDKYSYKKEKLLICKKIISVEVDKINIDEKTGKLSSKKEKGYFFKILSEDVPEFNKYYYGLGKDFIDIQNIKLKSNKEKYIFGEEIIVSSNIIKTINGNIIKDGTPFLLIDKDILYSSGGIIKYKKNVEKPGKYKDYLKYIDYTDKDINIILETNSFIVENGDYYNIGNIKPIIKLVDNKVVVDFGKDKKIEFIEFRTQGKSYNDNLIGNTYDIDKNILIEILFGKNIKFEKIKVDISGYNIKDNKKVFTSSGKIIIDTKKYLNLLNRKINFDNNEIKNLYLTGDTDEEDLIYKNLNQYSEEELDNLEKKYKKEIEKYEKENSIINIMYLYKKVIDNIYIILGGFITFLILIVILYKYIKNKRKK